jgi:hypothetical protein
MNIKGFNDLKGMMDTYKQMLGESAEKCPECGKSPCVCEQEIPEEIAKEDASDFIVAASAAKKAGKKKFTFGGKEYPVTIKTDVKTEEFKTCEGCKTESKCMAESKCMGKSESSDEQDELKTKKKGAVEINPDKEI